MDKFPMQGVLSVSTGVLMGDIGGVYRVINYLIGRDAFNYELAHYGKAAAEALLICHPELPSEVDGRGWEAVRDQHIEKWGDKMELDPALKSVLADDKNPAETLREMGFTGDIIVVST